VKVIYLGRYGTQTCDPQLHKTLRVNWLSNSIVWKLKM